MMKRVATTRIETACAAPGETRVTADEMRAAIDAPVRSPTPGTLAAARAIPIAARIPDRTVRYPIAR